MQTSMNFKREHSARTFRFRPNTASLYVGITLLPGRGESIGFLLLSPTQPLTVPHIPVTSTGCCTIPVTPAGIHTLKAREYKCLHLIHEHTHTRTGVCRHRARQECKYVLLLIMESTLAGGGRGHKELLLRFLRLRPPFSTQLTIFRQHGLVPSFAR